MVIGWVLQVYSRAFDRYRDDSQLYVDNIDVPAMITILLLDNLSKHQLELVYRLGYNGG